MERPRALIVDDHPSCRAAFKAVLENDGFAVVGEVGDGASALTAARGASLVQLRAEHPDLERVQRMLDRLGLDLRITRGFPPAIIATIDSPHGRVELR